MSVRIFLSTVSDEFRAYRDALRGDLTRHNVEVKVQEDFKDLGGDTLDKLDVYIAQCDAVVHLVGDMKGSAPPELALRALRNKYPDLADKLPPLGEMMGSGISLSYTQWEAWLALYHDKRLFIAKPGDGAERGPNYAPTEASRAAQAGHLAGLGKAGRYPGHTFTSPADLAKHIYSTGILDLLVQAYGEEQARARDVAEGFIREMAKRVAGDRALDFEGMQQAVRTAIDLYESEIAGGQTRTNIDAIVDEALARARSLVDAGKSGLARAALRKAAESMRREEEERRERYVAGVTALYHRARDIALAAYDGDAAAEAIILLAEAVHGANAAMVAQSLNWEAETLYEYGRDRGSKVHLVASIVLRRKLLDAVSSDEERGRAQDDLGIALATLGERESSTARLEEAVAVLRKALKERTRGRVPLEWAATQNYLGNALLGLGQREGGTARLEEAVLAFREALKEWTHDRVPLDWAGAQSNLGIALARLGERESGTARLEEAVLAFREALKEWTRESVPLDWAGAQNNLGLALTKLGERESGTARLDEAVAACREALKELTRERAPLDWARTQNNLGNALSRLGERESGTARLDEAVAAYREALKERTRERVPLDWATTQNNLGTALAALGERESGTARLEEAVAAYRDALKERTRERVPLGWATTQNNLGAALSRLGERESGTARLEEAVAAYRDALKEWTRERVPLDWAMTQNNLGVALVNLGERESGTARLEEAVAACRDALKERTRERVPLDWAMTQNNLGNALLSLGERESGMARLEEAVVAYREALKEWTRENAPYYRDIAQKNLDRTLKLLEERTAKNKNSG
jgi:tetratricopeptide (TPR) repeat protein